MSYYVGYNKKPYYLVPTHKENISEKLHYFKFEPLCIFNQILLSNIVAVVNENYNVFKMINQRRREKKERQDKNQFMYHVWA